MSTEIEKRVGNLLGSSKVTVPIDNSPSSSSQSGKQSVPGVDTSKPGPVSVTDAGKERVSLELKERQEKMKVRYRVFSHKKVPVAISHVFTATKLKATQNAGL